MQVQPSQNERIPTSGTISRLTVQKNNTDRMSVFIDDAFAFGVHKDLVLKFGLHKGRHLAADEQQEIRHADAVMRAKSRALSYLAYKDRTENEVRQKLEQKDFTAGAIDEAVERLYELNYLDDASYAHRYAEERARRGYGPLRVESDLRRRGVARMHIAAAVEAAYDPESIHRIATEHAGRRSGRLSREPDMLKRKRKLSDFLVRRGFSYETARRVVEETAAREEWT